MEKHLQLVGILNIVYRALLMILGALVLAASAWIGNFMESLTGPRRLPPELLDIIPMILLVVALGIFITSVAGIIGAIGVLQRKEWGRIVTLIVSFLNLLHIPIGTALGVYSIWALMNNESMKIFNPTAGGQLAPREPPPPAQAP